MTTIYMRPFWSIAIIHYFEKKSILNLKFRPM